MEDDLGTLEVPDLKEVCKDLGLKIAGKKDELVEVWSSSAPITR